MSLFEEEIEEGKIRLTISDEGLEEIASWCNFKLALAGISPAHFGQSDEELDEDYKVALLTFFILEEAYNRRGKTLPFSN